jgi:hypothetical protein
VNTSESSANTPGNEAVRPGEGVADFIPRLQAAAEAVRDADQARRLRHRQRNLLVVEAVDAGVSQRAVARALGIAQSRVITLLGTDHALDDA